MSLYTVSTKQQNLFGFTVDYSQLRSEEMRNDRAIGDSLITVNYRDMITG